MKNFSELEAPILSDPRRRARAEKERVKAVGEQIRFALAELRRVREVTQFELARVMKRPQSTVSRIEREGDMLLSTLATYVEALGGHLEIHAIIDHDRIPLTATTRSTKRRSA